ncbi:MAG: hypothetical protein ACRDZ7_06665 [Acidimicrobiia bacterium]
MPEVPAWPGLVLNIGGQGEIAYAVDINNLVTPTVDPELFIHSGRFIRADATALPVRAAVADAVKGNRFPVGDTAFRLAVAAEAFRVLRPGGVFRIWSATGGGRLWLPALLTSGFSPATLGAGYAEGMRP